MTSKPFQKLTKNGVLYVEIVHIYLFNKFNILFQGKERPAKTKLILAKLREVLVNFGFSKKFRKYSTSETKIPWRYCRYVRKQTNCLNISAEPF